MKKLSFVLILTGFVLGLGLITWILLKCFLIQPVQNYNYYENHILADLDQQAGEYLLEGEAGALCIIDENTPVQDDLITAQYGGLFCETDQETLYVKNPYKKLYPASLTKCMTALLVLENCLNLDKKVTVTEEAFEGLTEDASLADLKLGASYSVRDLLYALLVPSGNDAANVLAIYIGGSVAGFVEMMNEKALELGMVRTHFANPGGLQDENHYTCVYDLYLLVRACAAYPAFLGAANTREITISATENGSEFVQTYTSANSYIRGFTTLPEGLSVLASKTGYTLEAGRCLILLTRDTAGKTYISIVCKAKTYDSLYAEMNGLLQIIGK